MFVQQWFPFILFTNDLRGRFLAAASAKSNLDTFLGEIDSELRNASPGLIKRIESHSLFAEHDILLLHAIRRYLENDPISTTAIVYPRLEGLLRAMHLNSGSTVKVTQSIMAETAVAARIASKDGVLLVPDRFRTYLKNVYFANFSPASAQNEVSRHSVSHGVADQEKFDQKSALLGLLILDQLTYFLPDENVTV